MTQRLLLLSSLLMLIAHSAVATLVCSAYYSGTTTVYVVNPDGSGRLEVQPTYEYFCWYVGNLPNLSKPGTEPGGTPPSEPYPWLMLGDYESSIAYRAFATYGFSENVTAVASYSSKGMAFVEEGPPVSGRIEVPAMAALPEGMEKITVEGCNQSGACTTDSFDVNRTRTPKLVPRNFQVKWTALVGFQGYVFVEFIRGDLSGVSVLSNAGHVQLLTVKTYTEWLRYNPNLPGYPLWTEHVTSSGVSGAGTYLMADLPEDTIVHPDYAHVSKSASLSYQWGPSAQLSVRISNLSPFAFFVFPDNEISLSIP